MNKGGLVGEVVKRTGQTRADVSRVVDATIDTIRETVAKGERVALVGFGTFDKRKRGQRTARNPRKPEWSDLEFQMRNWWHFTWISGDHIVEQAVHTIDKIAWAMKDQMPARAWATHFSSSSLTKSGT